VVRAVRSVLRAMRMPGAEIGFSKGGLR
jgi:hypothetical protein